MPYYLRHYFSPDFNHKRLRPVAMADGSVNDHYLGYVQNVVAGQVLAELIYLDALPEGPATASSEAAENAATRTDDTDPPDLSADDKPALDPRYIYSDPVFPEGPNCGRDPRHPNRIIALTNGYCFYHQGLITVKKLLNVRRDINFHTGNILFVGDVVVHGNIFPGFSLFGSDILIKGMVDGGTVHARGKITCLGGIKGAPKALLQAESTIHLSHCEQARIVTAGNLIIDGTCMHSDLYVGGSLIVKGRLQGGNAQVGGMVYVKDQLGGGQNASTRISMGYNPPDFLRLQEMEEYISIQKEKLRYFDGRSRMGQHHAEECAPMRELASRKLAVAQHIRQYFWRAFSTDIARSEKNRIIVPGAVFPGVEISIGKAYLKIVEQQKDVFFRLVEDEITYNYPALSTNQASLQNPMSHIQGDFPQ